MQPSPAEVARTLAAGRLAGTVQVACRASDRRRWLLPAPGPHDVRQATDCTGQVLLLSRSGSVLARALDAPTGGDVAVVLRVDDVPPVDGAPVLGRLRLAGWAQALSGPAAREAALEYAETNPDNDLLGVGRDCVLHRVDVAEVRLERAGQVIAVDVDDYLGAEPDPLHAQERDLLVDLAEHHAAQVGGFIRRQLTEAGHPPGDGLPRAVRLDRYGLTVAAGDAYRARLSFPRAVRDQADLARMLHPVLCLRCGRDGRHAAWPMSPAR